MRVFLTFLIAVGCAGFVGGCAATGARTAQSQRSAEVISLLGQQLDGPPPGADVAKLESELAEARARLAEAPQDPARIVWVGRRLGYLWRMKEAVAVFTGGIEQHPEYAPLYRHRGHRFISMRRFDEAIADFETAATLIEGAPEVIEADGMPNARNIPLTTMAFNVWYHLGLTRYLKGDYDAAMVAFRNCLTHSRGLHDNIVSVVDWMYMTLQRADRGREADALLGLVREKMNIIENFAYHRRLLMYKGVIAPDELLDVESASALDLATLGFGLGNWHWCNGRRDRAREIWRKVVAGPYWPAFGYIAAEVDLYRQTDR